MKLNDCKFIFMLKYVISYQQTIDGFMVTWNVNATLECQKVGDYFHYKC